MNLLVLCAGYATRLYPLTLNRPKPLLEVAGVSMLDRLLVNLGGAASLKRVVVVTNHKFAPHFEDWALLAGAGSRVPITIVDDQTVSEADRLGAIGDIRFALDEADLRGDDLLIVAGDNLFDQPQACVRDLVGGAEAAVGVYDVVCREEIKKFGNVSVDGDGMVVRFVEKPTEPESTLAAIALYYYAKETLPLIDTYLEEGNQPDQPGRLVAWLCGRIPVAAWPVTGKWFDIGSHESLAEAEAEFQMSGDKI